MPLKLLGLTLYAASPFLFAFGFNVDQGRATVVAAILLFLSTVYQTWMINRVHALANSNLSVAIATKDKAEAALKTATDLNVYLQQQLNIKIIREGGEPLVVAPPSAVPSSKEPL